MSQAIRRVTLCCAALLCAAVTVSADRGPRLLAGANFTNELGRGGYAEPASDSALADLRRLGANCIALVPYGVMRTPTDTRLRYGGAGSWESEASLRHAVARAQALGMRVMIKPQVWVAHGAFTGDLRFEGQAWQEWWAGYREFALHYVGIATATGAECVCIGTELGGVTRAHPAEWRALIRDVRRVFRGEVTYSANWWDEYETVPFWDALDCIGISWYFPVSGDTDLARVTSVRETCARVAVVSRRVRKRVFITEIGVPSRRSGALEPWHDRTDAPADDALQAHVASLVYGELARQTWVRGVLWWKWHNTRETDSPGTVTYNPRGRPVLDVLRRFFRRST
jgi:hypothetical protein